MLIFTENIVQIVSICMDLFDMTLKLHQYLM